MLPESLRDRWDGRAWRWWALAAGIVLTAVTVALGLLLTSVLPGSAWSLIMLGLATELFALGVVGSGMLEGLSGRAIAGGMARQPLEDRRTTPRRVTHADQSRRDRMTIRAGLIALPVFVTFLVMLYR